MNYFYFRVTIVLSLKKCNIDATFRQKYNHEITGNA